MPNAGFSSYGHSVVDAASAFPHTHYYDAKSHKLYAYDVDNNLYEQPTKEQLDGYTKDLLVLKAVGRKVNVFKNVDTPDMRACAAYDTTPTFDSNKHFLDYTQVGHNILFLWSNDTNTGGIQKTAKLVEEWLYKCEAYGTIEVDGELFDAHWSELCVGKKWWEGRQWKYRMTQYTMTRDVLSKYFEKRDEKTARSCEFEYFSENFLKNQGHSGTFSEPFDLRAQRHSVHQTASHSFISATDDDRRRPGDQQRRT